VRNFVDHLWRKVMFLAYQQEGLEGNKWGQFTRTLEDLRQSVQPITSPADRQALLKLVPQLLKDLRMGLTWAGIAQGEMDAFFKALEAIHLAHLRGKPTPQPDPEPENSRPDAVAPPGPAGDGDKLEPYLQVVDSMSMGLWVEFC